MFAEGFSWTQGSKLVQKQNQTVLCYEENLNQKCHS